MKGIGRTIVVGAMALAGSAGAVLFTTTPATAVPLLNVSMAWGANALGQLGNGTTTDSSSPGTVNGPSGSLQLNGILQIATGDHFALALLDTGNVVSWGDNSNGQLGDGTTTQRDAPVAVSGLPANEVKEVAAGGHFALALLKNGTVMAWGSNSNGQLGNGTTTDSSVPVAVSGLSSVYQVQAGEAFSAAVQTSGDVQTWGANASGQLGNGSTTDSDVPVAVSGLSNVHLVSAGSDFALALLTNKDVWSWGDNAHGQLGNASTTSSDVPVPVSGIHFVHAIAAGGAHSMAILSLGQVATWGDNSNGQLGNGTTTDSDVPVDLPLTNAYALAAGALHSLALLRNGTVQSWGSNSNGQLGNGTTTDSHVPAAVPGISGVTSISAGADFSLDKGQNLAPRFSTRPRAFGFVDLPFAFTIRVHSHPTVATISETGSLPPGLSFTDHGNDTASISGTPSTGSQGVYIAVISATTSVGGTSHLSVRILIR